MKKNIFYEKIFLWKKNIFCKKNILAKIYEKKNKFRKKNCKKNIFLAQVSSFR